MKKLVAACCLGALGTLLSGCALTHDQVVQRAQAKSNAELCMGAIQFPQYGSEINAELVARGHACDWTLAGAQVQAAQSADASRHAAITAAAASWNTQPGYQVQQPVALSAPAAFQVQPIQTAQRGVSAYFTGKQKQVQTVTYQYGWSCEYSYAGNTFWRTFTGSCPASVQVL